MPHKHGSSLRPRGLRSPVGWASPTYAYEKNQPSRHVELRRALKDEEIAEGSHSDKEEA